MCTKGRETVYVDFWLPPLAGTVTIHLDAQTFGTKFRFFKLPSSDFVPTDVGLQGLTSATGCDPAQRPDFLSDR